MITLDIKHQIATVTLARPEKHNAFDNATIKDLTQIFEQVDHDPAARVMVMASTGKSFSAGADLAWMQKMAQFDYQQNLEDATKLAEMLSTLHSMSKPTIARVQGAAYGGAVGLVSCCDIGIAASNALFCLSEVKLGLIPATISPYVIEALGPRVAKRYFLTAERFDAHAAMHHGLLHHVCEPEDLDGSIKRFAKMLIDNGPNALHDSKKLVSDFARRPIDAELILESSARIARSRVSQEGQEGLRAFFEKRNPRWQNTKNADGE